MSCVAEQARYTEARRGAAAMRHRTYEAWESRRQRQRQYLEQMLAQMGVSMTPDEVANLKPGDLVPVMTIKQPRWFDWFRL